LILVLSVAVAYRLNIGHRLFPRDATEDLPSRRTRFLTRRHLVPVLLFRDFPWLVRLSGCGSVVCATFRNLAPANLARVPVRRAVSSTPPDTPPHATGNTHPRTRRTRRGAVPQTPFWRARRTPVPARRTFES